MTRRRLGMLFGGGVLAAVGLSRIASTSWGAAPGEISRGVGAWTSFGTVAVTRAERQARLGTTSAGTGHGAHPAASTGVSLEPGNHTWGDVVALELEVHNGSAAPVLVSPGQLRLRVGPDGPTVTPRDAGRAVAAIDADAVERFWVSYLAPSGVDELFAEFDDPRQGSALQLDMPSVVRRPDAGLAQS